jgi:predicted permease
MDRLLQDLKFAGRVLVKDRGFTTTVALTLAICIGANAAIFAIVNSVLLQPLPVPDPAQLVHMYNAYPGAGVEAGAGSTGVPDYYDRLRETTVFQEQALYNPRGVTIGQDGSPQRITAMAGTPSLLRLLKVQPIRGRIFTEEDGEVDRHRKVILTYEAWHQLFGARENAVGSDVRLNGEPYTVVGVLPAGFIFLDPDVKLWIPIAFSTADKADDRRHSNNWSYLARLKPGATIEQARQQIDALNARNLDRFPQFKEPLVNARFHTGVVSLHAHLVREVRATLFLLWGGVAFVLLIGVVNVANLMLVRSSGRMKELATRHALGAGMGRIARQLVTETIVVTAAAGGLGLLLGWGGLKTLGTFGFQRTPQGTSVTLNGRVVVFTIVVAAAVGLLMALAPVLGLRRLNLSQAFREDGRSGTASRGSRTIRRALVAAQVAFAFMLLVGAGLMLASFQRILAIQPGFDPDRVLTGAVTPPASRYKDDPQLVAFADRLLERVRALPGVEAAGITSNIPLGNNFNDSVILAEGYVMAPGESLISPYSTDVSPGFFEAMRIPVVRGRLFRASDDDRAPKVVIVDQRLAARFFGTRDPIGRRLWKPNSPQELSSGPGKNSAFFTIVGVVGNVRTRALTENEPVGAYYFPVAQDAIRSMTLVARTAGDPESLTETIRREVTALDPELPFYGVRPMQARVDQSLIGRRTPMLLGTLFAGIAVFLACIGIYGVLAYQVAQRRREIGIRLALGSEPARIFQLVLREGLVLLGTGVVVGFAGAIAIRRAIETQLFGIRPLDPVVLIAVTATLIAVAAVACGVPARRAAKIDPLIALTDQ